ncbi:hypothetical protein [Facilibium subflavum]|uniref:hypothetical protein n=1 Tax=Facilibium subflavum TaxID=2219058 RepID=UPI000E65CB20|nr:hypothetical protein [Facilibium subflavum]
MTRQEIISQIKNLGLTLAAVDEQHLSMNDKILTLYTRDLLSQLNQLVNQEVSDECAKQS